MKCWKLSEKMKVSSGEYGGHEIISMFVSAIFFKGFFWTNGGVVFVSDYF